MNLIFKTPIHEVWRASSGAIEVYSMTALVDCCATIAEAHVIVNRLESR